MEGSEREVPVQGKMDLQFIRGRHVAISEDLNWGRGGVFPQLSTT